MVKTPPRKKSATKKTAAKSKPTPLREHTSFRLEKRVTRDDVSKLPGSFALTKQAIQVVWRHRALFIGILLVLVLLEISVAGALITRDNFFKAKESVDMSGGIYGSIGGSLTLFVYMFGLTGQGGSPAGVIYQGVILTIISLATIWALRQVYAKDVTRVRLRDAFYSGMYPLVPYLLLVGLIIAQLLPMALGLGLYTVVSGNGLATNFLEQLLWVPLSLSLALLSLYLITSSVFAVYIATLPNMTPIPALRSARELVSARRFAIIRRLLFMPLAYFLISAIFVVPSILFLGAAAPWVFFAITVLLFPLGHTYMYALYRSLLLR